MNNDFGDGGRNINDISQVTGTIGDVINQYVIASNGAIIKDNVKDLKTYCLENDISTTSMLTLQGEEKNLRKMKEQIEAGFSELDTTDICDISVHK